MNKNKNIYWQRFYKNKKFNKEINFPSQFSIFTLSQKQKNKVLIEFGCGNGRDASYMCKYYDKIYAFDISERAIKNNKNKFKKLKNLNFSVCDVTKNFNSINLKKLKKNIYARFFLHTLNDTEIKMFVKLVSKILNKNEKIFLEYRTNLDKNKKKIFKNHYRNFLNPIKIINIFKKEKIKNIYSVNGHGLAIFNDEDPHVSRQIFEKK
tara:strand:- start:649 stop:1272 length:624 start_codon:yes stop_codon:yes gene_type:complete